MINDNETIPIIDTKSNFTLEKGVRIKVVYSEYKNLKKDDIDLTDKRLIKVMFGEYIGINDIYLIVRYLETRDPIFFNHDNIITFSGVRTQ